MPKGSCKQQAKEMGKETRLEYAVTLTDPRSGVAEGASLQRERLAESAKTFLSAADLNATALSLG